MFGWTFNECRRWYERTLSSHTTDVMLAPMREPLTEVLGADRVLLSELDRVRYASDASPYLLVPRAVAVPRNAGDVATAAAS